MFNLHKCVDLGFANEGLFLNSHAMLHARPYSQSSFDCSAQRLSPANYYVTLGKLLNLSGRPFLHL